MCVCLPVTIQHLCLISISIFHKRTCLLAKNVFVVVVVFCILNANNQYSNHVFHLWYSWTDLQYRTFTLFKYTWLILHYPMYWTLSVSICDTPALLSSTQSSNSSNFDPISRWPFKAQIMITRQFARRMQICLLL